MTIENRDDYIKYRFHRDEESFDEALKRLILQPLASFLQGKFLN